MVSALHWIPMKHLEYIHTWLSPNLVTLIVKTAAGCVSQAGISTELLLLHVSVYLLTASWLSISSSESLLLFLLFLPVVWKYSQE